MGWGWGGERGERRGGRVVSRNTCSTFTVFVREGRARREGGAMRRGVGDRGHEERNVGDIK